MENVISRRCDEPTCNTTASFGFESDGHAVCCSAHKLDGMENVKTRRCVEPGCKTTSNRDWGDGLLCARCYAAAHPEDPLVKARNKTEEKLAQFYSSQLGADFAGVSNMRNARGGRAPAWALRYELDFLLADGSVNDECDGDQHFKVLSYFNAEDPGAERDATKMALALTAGVSVTRIPQKDVWGDRYDWRALKRAQLSLAVDASARRREPVVLFACTGEDDRRYASHVEALCDAGGCVLASKAFYCWMEAPDVMAVQNAVSGATSHWRHDAHFSLGLMLTGTGGFVREGFTKQTRLAF